jgi:hypothetical protein
MEKVQSSKFEVEKFSDKNNFELWKLKMRDLLVQQGLQKALAGKTKKQQGNYTIVFISRVFKSSGHC